ncbi:MAG: hypothetical protein QOI03_1006 [Solirubrobacteraceae bacterium]|nr:hypothetical protein [Solirubrobacteraceae bacterium]
MQDVQDGERVALGVLYDRLASRAYRTAFSVCRDRECAQEAVQDAFVSMWSSRATYQSARGSVSGWAMSIVRHRALYLAQRRTVRAAREEGASQLERQPGQDDVPGEYATRAGREQLETLLGRLPTAQSDVIRLGFFDGLTHEQIARRLDLPRGTVKGRMRLGLTKLRSELEP